MATPAYPPIVVTASLTAVATISTTADGTALVTLPPIAALAVVPITPAAKVGDVIVVRSNVSGETIVTGPGLTRGVPFGGVLLVLASGAQVWQVIDGVPILGAVPPGATVGTVSLGVNNIPPGIATPGTPAGFLPVALPGGGVGLMPYWQ